MPKKLLDQLNDQAVVFLPEDRLSSILEEAQVVQEVDTRMRGWIRILKMDAHLVLQEHTDKGQLAVRKMASLEQARKLIEERLETYDRMWDGCGCRIDYSK